MLCRRYLNSVRLQAINTWVVCVYLLCRQAKEVLYFSISGIRILAIKVSFIEEDSKILEG